MTGRFTVPLRIAAVTATAALVSAMAALPAAAAEGDVKVVNTETVQVYTDASGKVDTQRVYEQLALTGAGSVEVRNPISEDGLRNLDGFGGFDVEDGQQVADVEVDGEEHLRTVSDFNGKLPLQVSVQYYLDGKRVDAGDVVGEDGELEVVYTVKNVTAQDQEVTFDDGKGGTVTKTVSVPIPMVGSLTTTVPGNFTEVRSEKANIAGDGKGGTKLSFTMTLFPPLGSDTAELSYTAKITDGLVPRASISALPVNPLESPTFKTAAESYQGGADTGIELTDGASQIDANLLKLRDGAGELLAGLIQLRDGANELEAGLAGVAAPGARQLADGAGELNDGLFKIDEGAGKLADGSGRLSAGAGELADGAGKLSDGTGQLDAGAGKLADGAERLSEGAGKAAVGGRKLRAGARKLDTKLGDLAVGAFDLNAGAVQIADGQQKLLNGLTLLESGVKTLPDTVRENLKTNAEYQGLVAGLKSLSAGLGSPSQLVNPATGQPTLYGGLLAVKSGLRTPGGYADSDCEDALSGVSPTQCGAADAVQTVSGLLSKAAAEDITALIGGAGAVYDYVASTSGGACAPRTGGTGLPPMSALQSPHPACVGAAKVAYGLGAPAGTGLPGLESGGMKVQTEAAAGALENVYDAVDAEMLPGLTKMLLGVYNPGADPDCAVGASTTGDPSDDCAAQQAAGFFAASIPVLVDGITTSVSNSLLENISVPAAGCDPDAPTLICGASALAVGGSDLAEGTGKLVDGAGQLDAGGTLLADKVAELAAGLRKLDSGAGELSAGAGTLKGGTSELDAGAQKLSAGAGQLSDGAGELSAGAGKLADGTGEAADGSTRLSEGAGKLADGLGDAADGSGRLADGLGKAADGAPALQDGAQRLSDEGTSKLVEAGESTAQNYGEMYATIAAGAERAQAEKMAYGAPEGAIGLTAYSYEIRGEDGESGRNVARGLGGVALLGAGAAAFALRRRFI